MQEKSQLRHDQLLCRYKKILAEYLNRKTENVLYSAQQLSKYMIEEGVSPEEVVSTHIEAVNNVIGEMPNDVRGSFELLLEVMVGYGFQYMEHRSLREEQIQLHSELELAASMQQTLLPSVPENIPSLDLGVISVAAKKMSGDYYHLSYDDEGYLGVAIADIIGKGIPAALSMSLIKYAIESLLEQHLEPRALLASINRVVEKNIDPSMFITMLYGFYDVHNHCFHYASAGHEPGVFYSAKNHTFHEMKTKGPVLGLRPFSEYEDFRQPLDKGDMVILFSDGVTESRKNGIFMEREDWLQMLDEHLHLPAQKMVEVLQESLYSASGYELEDDQTIIVIKREV